MARGLASTVAVLVLLVQIRAAAQTTTPPFWTEAGASFTTIFTEAGEHDGPGERPNIPYGHTSSLSLAGGLALPGGTSLGAKLILTPHRLDANASLDTLAVIGYVSYPPFKSKGFYVSGGLGLGVLTDRVSFEEGPPPSAGAKGMLVELGAGWEWRLRGPLAVRVSGTQRVLALGDLPTALPELTLSDVIVNDWSVGASLVVRVGRRRQDTTPAAPDASRRGTPLAIPSVAQPRCARMVQKSGGSLTIATIDTSPDLIELFRTALAERGATIASAFTYDWRDAKMNLERFVSEHAPDAVIYDIAPPYEANWRLYRHFRSMPVLRDLPFVVTSTNIAQVQPLAGDETLYEIAELADVRRIVGAAIDAAQSRKAG